MQNYIINSFFIQNINTINNIYEYLKIHYSDSVEINNIKIELQNLIKNKIEPGRKYVLRMCLEKFDKVLFLSANCSIFT